MASSVKAIASGVPTLPHDPTRRILKYLPPPRRPWHPSTFRRENVTQEQLQIEWSKSRTRHGPGYINSGYSTAKEHVFDDYSTPPTPIHELVKFMPDIRVPGLHSTPESLMHVRNGHRVTHDLIHSYDGFVSGHKKYGPKGERDPQLIDHDNISPMDEGFHGIHPSVFGSRARIYRYLRRPPYSEERMYYRRYVAPFPAPPSERRMQQEIIRLCDEEKNLEAACATYRLLVHRPTAEVVTAMLKCCGYWGLLSDAAALYLDVSGTDRKMARETSVLSAYLDVALQVNHPQHVLTVLGIVHGTKTDNFRYREVPSTIKYELGRRALVWMLTKSYPHARTVYKWLYDQKLLNYDVEEVAGNKIGELLTEVMTRSETSESDNDSVAESITDLLSENNLVVQQKISQKILLLVTQIHMEYTFCHEGTFTITWLEREFFPIDLHAVVRLSRDVARAQRSNATDIAVHEGEEVSDVDIAYSVHKILLLLSPDLRRPSQSSLLPYLHKSKPSRHNPNVRVVPAAEELQHRGLLPFQAGYSFYHDKNGAVRTVTESYPILDSTNVAQMYHGRDAVQRYAKPETWF